MSVIDVTVGTNQEATKLINVMSPGTVFTHQGLVFLKVNNMHQVQALYIKDVNAPVQEVGSSLNGFPKQPWMIQGFDSGDYGRVVDSANLDIQL